MLEEKGIVARRFYEEHPPRAEYRLTDKGKSLGPIMKSLLEWGTKHTMDQVGTGKSRAVRYS